jgi:hypothetical protein
MLCGASEVYLAPVSADAWATVSRVQASRSADPPLAVVALELLASLLAGLVAGLAALWLVDVVAPPAAAAGVVDPLDEQAVANKAAEITPAIPTTTDSRIACPKHQAAINHRRCRVNQLDVTSTT